MIPWIHVISLKRLSQESDVLQIFTDDNKVHQFTGFRGWFELVWNLVNFLFKTITHDARPNKTPTPKSPNNENETKNNSGRRIRRYSWGDSKILNNEPLEQIQKKNHQKNHNNNSSNKQNNTKERKHKADEVETSI